ncbi:MAG: LytTR family DNA-binding domain-containing protein [Flavobacteriaceae bacterium]|nr:LytTR family DNA-binding domain-containing protein [Flavobacteriaceae bacterium]
MKFKVLIVDDELQSRNILNSFCEEYFKEKVDVVAQCSNVDDAIVAIEKHQPDLLFLDIDMPDKNGFDLVNHFLYKPFEIVFITGHANHYVDAIKCSAFDYLMKPINPLNLRSVIERLENKSLFNSINRNEILIANIKNKTQLVVSNSNGFNNITINSILYLEADENYTNIVLLDEKILVTKTLKAILDLIADKKFLRVSKSFGVNINHVIRFISDTYQLEMINGDKVQVSEKLFTKKMLIDAFNK